MPKYESSRERNRRKFKESILPRILKDLNLKVKISKNTGGYNEVSQNRPDQGQREV